MKAAIQYTRQRLWEAVETLDEVESALGVDLSYAKSNCLMLIDAHSGNTFDLEQMLKQKEAQRHNRLQEQQNGQDPGPLAGRDQQPKYPSCGQCESIVFGTREAD